MRALETFLASALILIGLYLVLTSQQSAAIIREIAAGLGRVFGTLQGRTV